MHAVIKRQSKSACCDGIIDVDSILKIEVQKYIRKRNWPTIRMMKWFPSRCD